ncbi:Uncharacterised protein family UPF0052, partial [Armatimonadetes bacterium GBS]
MSEGRWRWLLPGIDVKRWLLVSALGVVIALIGVWVLLGGKPTQWLDALYRAVEAQIHRWATTARGEQVLRIALGLTLVAIGGGVWWWGLRRAWRTLVRILQPRASGRVWDVLSRQILLKHGRRVVVIGGGTGLSTMLRGLKRYTANIVAVVKVT